ncbi:SDR family oxidoreductase [Zavarzinia compransoris]|uniref:Short-chain dehydrogenase n=1 Tax=Zavarzinia compransoris TaxID=1264899 RepID=A0A317DXC2_9PROT|nr:SDR family oxidoreductase [Zavarzinia compransoris]PWR19112.1 short-chain dehydrogenase [Zavarzinia compransoris]TDP49122.1 NAD(P)-dependent dehydrogenase (short-subunit alcohol dehydrogenase family) [Zavarzinia compransoris]
MTGVMLITGASRGLGRGFAEHYAAAGWRVHAVTRNGAALAGLAGVEIHALDITDRKAIATLRTRFAEEKLDLVVNNAGDWGPGAQDLGPIDAEAWMAVLRLNTLAPYYVGEALADPLARGRGTLVTISSGLASIEDNRSGGDYVYRSSKAAVNMVVRSLARDLAPRQITVVALSPGWVRTAMGGDQAPLSVEESVAAMRRTIAGLTLKDSGKFLNPEGKTLPW